MQQSATQRSGSRAGRWQARMTAGVVGWYVTVWTICGTTALIAAVALVFVPRLAFADPEQNEDRAAAVREETAG